MAGGRVGGRFARVSFDELAARPGHHEEAGAVRCIVQKEAAWTALPALTFGASFLAFWPVRESPGWTEWQAAGWLSTSPRIFALRAPILHSKAGILVLGDAVVAETLKHTSPRANAFREDDGAIVLDDRPATTLAGTFISLLAGGAANYFHETIDVMARLALFSAEALDSAAGILLPAGCDVACAMLRLLGIRTTVVFVGADQRMAPERILLPTSIHDEIAFHPCAMAVFDRVSRAVPRSAAEADLPARFIIDRSQSRNRVLRNEDRVIEALREFGFVPVRLELYDLETQIRLFRNASFIVAPHGAGLTNIVYAGAGTIVLELHMDAYINWSFRRIAALRGLVYDCLIGTATKPWTDLSPAVHGLSWTISIDHVLAAVRALDQPPPGNTA